MSGPLFPLGQVVATPGALAVMVRSNVRAAVLNTAVFTRPSTPQACPLESKVDKP